MLPMWELSYDTGYRRGFKCPDEVTCKNVF